ncbi:hypothetical protein F6B43_18405 [Microbacterium rhizomatis]|uniref:Signal peptidase I n=1 Tax=Microbacterium rhizomatis TaxID=1631477 RepID=A0A5J5IX77_9MICO|nr:hypothetical protein F6B43_18405 [Microbacterium rhizomatis]
MAPISVEHTAILTVVGLVYYGLMAVALWRIFQKAGLPGILGIIPIVNVFYLVKIAGMSMWLTLLYIIPVVGFVFGLIVAFKLGSAFGKGGAFSFFLLWLFSFVGYLVLGFGSSKYIEPVRA